MRVLAVGAHPDDLEILCGGTLARWAADGASVVMAALSDGAAGHTEIAPDELRLLREEEARAAADVIGAETLFGGLPDEYVVDSGAARDVTIELVRRARPDVCLTHFPGDYHPDHRATAALVFAATFAASLPNVATKSSSHPIVPPMAYFDTLATTGFEPEEWVDITETLDVKLEMLACHATQLEWLHDHDGLDVLAMVETTARLRGMQCGVAAAEGFRIERQWLRARPTRFLPWVDGI